MTCHREGEEPDDMSQKVSDARQAFALKKKKKKRRVWGNVHCNYVLLRYVPMSLSPLQTDHVD